MDPVEACEGGGCANLRAKAWETPKLKYKLFFMHLLGYQAGLQQFTADTQDVGSYFFFSKKVI
jgi:hypothetical protein